MDDAILVLMIGAIVGLVEVVKQLVGRLQTKRSVLTGDEHRALMMHLSFRDNGSPNWYVPDSYGKVQQDMVNTLLRITMTQDQIAKTLDRIESRLSQEIAR